MFLREFVAKPIIGFLAFFTLGIVYFWLAKKQRFARLLQSPLTDSNHRPLLTMRSDQQPVATTGNEFGLFKPFSAVEDLPPLAPASDRNAP